MKYYLIFKITSTNKGEFVCIVDNEEIAYDFCENNYGFYCLSNEELEKVKEEETDLSGYDF